MLYLIDLFAIDISVVGIFSISIIGALTSSLSVFVSTFFANWAFMWDIKEKSKHIPLHFTSLCERLIIA